MSSKRKIHILALSFLPFTSTLFYGYLGTVDNQGSQEILPQDNQCTIINPFEPLLDEQKRAMGDEATPKDIDNLIMTYLASHKLPLRDKIKTRWWFGSTPLDLAKEWDRHAVIKYLKLK